MVKKLKIVIFLMLTMILLTGKVNAFSIQTEADSKEFNVGDEITYKIDFDEKIIAANFNINYNSNAVELIGSETSGLDVAVKNGKVAGIYADINGVGTRTFEIKFRAKVASSQVIFSLDNDAKFRGINQEISYTGDSITGINAENSITITNTTNSGNTNSTTDNTLSPTTLPFTGSNVVLITILIIIALVLCVIFKIKYKNIKNILPLLIIGIVAISGVTYNSYAVTNNATINYQTINESAVARIIIENESRTITKQEMLGQDSSITSIKDNNQIELENTSIVKTGDSLVTQSGNYIVALMGDANKDGYICDTDDLMVIINNHLGKSSPDSISTITANLDDTDNTLDIDDIKIMKNIYLGKTSLEISNNNTNNSDSNNNTNNNTNNNQSTEPEETSSNDTTSDKKVLVAYFSWSGNTENMANYIKEQTNADLFEITPVVPYSTDYNTVGEVARQERDENARPEIANLPSNLNEYDTVFIGYPIWWHTAPMIIGTFLNAYDFEGVDIYPFTQSSSMDTEQFNNSINFVKENTKNGTVHDGLFARSSNTSAIDEYLQVNGFVD